LDNLTRKLEGLSNLSVTNLDNLIPFLLIKIFYNIDNLRVKMLQDYKNFIRNLRDKRKRSLTEIKDLRVYNSRLSNPNYKPLLLTLQYPGILLPKTKRRGYIWE